MQWACAKSKERVADGRHTLSDRTAKRSSLTRLTCASVLTLLVAASCTAQDSRSSHQPALEESGKRELATFGSGCFWCTEAVYERVKGVDKVVSGYSGGAQPNPTYQSVLTGRTGHAEVVQLTFDPEVISYEDLLNIFWKTHDPTTLNRQGPDVGTQYRSVIFYHNDDQKRTAEAYMKQLDESKAFKKPIVTEISR